MSEIPNLRMTCAHDPSVEGSAKWFREREAIRGHWRILMEFDTREVQRLRALIPEVIEQLETFNRKLIDGTAVRVPDHMDFEAAIAKLRNAGGPT